MRRVGYGRDGPLSVLVVIADGSMVAQDKIHIDVFMSIVRITGVRSISELVPQVAISTMITRGTS